MHPPLPAELRFTQLLKSTYRRRPRHHLHPHPARARSFHSSRCLPAARHPANNGGADNNGLPPGDDAHDDDRRSEVTREKSHWDDARLSPLPPAAASPHLSHQPDAAGQGQEQGQGQAQGSTFYGSSAKRRLRSRIIKDVDPGYKAPDWFVGNNMILYGEDALAVGSRSKIHTIAADLITGEPLEHTTPPSANGPPARSPTEGGTDALSSTALQGDATHQAVGDTEPSLDDVPTANAPSTPSAAVPRYFVVGEQYDEIERIARGLMHMAPAQKDRFESESIREHLVIQYAGKDGDLLLDHLVEDLARNLGCDLMTLDSQDLSELISHPQPHQQARVSKAGRLLSYDVYTGAFADSGVPHSSPSARPAEEDEEDDEMMEDFDDPQPSSPLGMPMVVGKPITIDLKSLFGAPARGTRADRPLSPMKVFSDMFGGAAVIKERDTPRPFAALVDGLLTQFLARRRRTAASSNPSSAPPSEQCPSAPSEHSHFGADPSKQTGVPTDAAIIHVKDLEAIQDVAIGGQFLNELYRQVAKRRAAGACLLLVGTDSARDEHEPYTKERITDTQTGDRDEISQNIVLTPVLPHTTSKLALLHDRKQRIATINMRHLWETMRYRKPAVFAHLEPGFWRHDFFRHLARSDRSCLEAHLWDYAYVQRLAAYIAGAAPPTTDIQANIDHAEQQASVAAGPGSTDPVISAATAHLSHSDKTKMRWAEKQAKETKVDVPVRHKSRDDSRLAEIRASASKYEKRLMGGIIEARSIATTFNDIHMPVETIDTLQTLTTLSLVRPDAFKYGVLASDRIPGLLLYGPPGTGKTLAAKAVAKESGATMLEVSAADINDMYVGEGEKNVKALFSLAKKLSPCVVFLDEADAMFSARSTQGRRVSHRELLNQFLKEWDGMNNDAGSAFIMVATNRPMDLDDAVLRRLPRRLLVDLPTEPDRLEILRIHLRHENLADDIDLAAIAQRTPFYSGSDLKNVCVAAALSCVREENELARKHRGEEPYRHPERRTLRSAHFERALDDIAASISEDMSSLREIKKFDAQFGDKRGRKKKASRLGFPVRDDDRPRDTVKVRES